MVKISKLIIPPIFLKLHLVYPFLKEKILYRNIILRDELKKQISEIPDINKIFSKEEIRQMYVSENVRDTIEHPDIFITQLRFYWYYNFFSQYYPDIFEKDTTILDVGGCNGIFLRSINKKGTIININKECVDFLNNEGISAFHGSGECIKLPNKSFDYVVSFQCLEHMPNPIMALNEFGRIARKNVFISIPLTEKTNIYDLDYWVKLKKESWKVKGDVKKGSGHIFEFSTNDLKKLMTHTNLIYKNNFPVLYFNNDSSYRKHYNNFYRSYFNFFILKTKE